MQIVSSKTMVLTRRTRLSHGRAAVFYTAAAAWCLCSAAAAAQRSTPWEPYTADADTVALYHLDAANPDTSVAPETDLEQGDVEIFHAPVADKTDPPFAANAFTMGETAELVGAGEFVREGRFLGGIRVHGNDGRLVMANRVGRGWTLECSLRAAVLPPVRAVLVDLPEGDPLRVSLLHDGRLAIDWMRGRHAESTWKYQPGKWFHLALVWRPVEIDGNTNGIVTTELSVLADSVAVFSSGVLPVDSLRDTVRSSPIAIGNDTAGDLGFDGWIDEVRISSVNRDFYVRDYDWVDTLGTRPSPAGQPYFRDDSDLLFRCSFNGTLEPDRAGAGVALPAGLHITSAAIEKEPKQYAFRFGNGVQKQGLLLTTGAKSLVYEGLKAQSQSGTIAFWCRPNGWDNAKQWNLTMPRPQEIAPVFGLAQEGRSVMDFNWVKTPDTDFNPSPIDLQPGSWMHVALEWSGGRTQAYLNGEPWQWPGSARWARSAWDQSRPVSLYFSQTAAPLYVDDFRIYRRPLSPLEIKNLTLLYNLRRAPQPLPAIDAKLAFDIWSSKLEVVAEPLMPGYQNVATASMKVFKKGDPKTLAEVSAAVDAGGPFTLGATLPESGFGDYTVTTTLFDAAKVPLKSVELSYTRKQPPWWHSTAGISNRVMPDWTPITVKKNAVSVVGRTVTFDASGFPSRVTSAGGEVLAAPIVLRASRGGKPLALVPRRQGPTVHLVDETRAEVEGGYQGDGFSLDVSSYIEFDGMMWFKMEIKPNSEGDVATLDSLELTVPYAPDSANLMHWWSGQNWFRDDKNVWIGEVPVQQGTVFRSNDKDKVRLADRLRGSFIPYLMLTGDKRGMAWFGENDKGWTQSTEVPAVSVVRSPGSVDLKLEIISSALTLQEPRTISFGLQPIPSRPLDPAWRGYAGWTEAPDQFYGHNLKSDMTGLANGTKRAPDDWNWGKVPARFQLSQIRGYPRGDQPRSVTVPGLYQRLRDSGGAPADTQEWFGQWFATGILNYTPELIDYSAYSVNEFARRGFVSGLYMDDSYNVPQYDVARSPAYLLPDGTPQPGFDWLQQRAYCRRLRQIFYDNHVTPHLTTHMTHTGYVPYQSFFDVQLDGEDHYNEAPDSTWDFMDAWSPARLRFQNPEKWGIASMWLGWHQGGFNPNKFQPWGYKHERAYTAALLVHDLAWLNRLESGATLDYHWIDQSKILSDPATRFLPYWDLQGLAEAQTPGLYISAWKRAGLCVIAIANWGVKRADCTVRLDPNAMGFGAAVADRLELVDVDHANLTRTFGGAAFTPAEPFEVPLLGNTVDVRTAGNAAADARAAEQDQAALDGAFEWKGGALHCPVRPHDFRLFVVRPVKPAIAR